MAAARTRSLIESGRCGGFFAACAAALLCSALVAGTAVSQTLYKYRGADGYWVYSDRIPADLSTQEPADRLHAGHGTGVWLQESTNAAGQSVLVAVNGFASWMQIAYRIEASRNLAPGKSTAGNALLAPLEETELRILEGIEPKAPVEVSFSYQYIYGHPGARHRPDQPYRLPYTLAAAHRVSQAFPDRLTHENAANRYAIDFEMPTGTPVRAARSGVVVETASEFFGSGSDWETSGDRANLVRILHDDGTLALYGHLNWRSIRVEPGQRVARGEHIADSGNSGFSSGPHLHFVVQRNRAGAMESVPVSFAGPEGAVVSPETGDRPVAY